MFHSIAFATDQFPWQTEAGIVPLLRIYKVFGESSVDAVIQRELGMTMRQLLHLGWRCKVTF